MSQMDYSMSQAARLAQKMSPHQYMAAGLLQATVQDLRAEVRQHQERNPAIEDVRWTDEPVLGAVVGDPAGGRSTVDNTPLDFTPDSPAANRILSADGRDNEFFCNMESASQDSADERRLANIRETGSGRDLEREERRQYLFDSTVSVESFDAYLLRQVHLADFNADERAIAEIVIANLDDDGYFEGSLPDISMSTGFPEEKVISVQRRICNTFDPPGIAARDLQECLLAQMYRFDDSPWEDEIRIIVERYLDDLKAGRFEKIRNALRLTEDEWKKTMTEFSAFSRKPALQKRSLNGENAGRNIADDRTRYIYPEIHAIKIRGRWTAVVSDASLPKIIISSEYRKMADDESVPKEARTAIRDYVRDAELLEDMLDDRQDKIRRVGQAIIDAQPDFFEKGMPGLRPLLRTTVAERLNLDDSVVSRAVKGKYMTTPFGTMELSRFFSSGLSTSNGEVTPMQVKAKIREYIGEEDPERPLSDDAIAKKLNEDGFKISRRTVAKYREAEGIEGSSGRRNQKNHKK